MRRIRGDRRGKWGDREVGTGLIWMRRWG